MTSHVVYEELAAGYALHALEPEDEQVFLHHLAACARCERELDVHCDTAAALAYGVGPSDLPDGMLERLRAAVAADSGTDVFAADPGPVSLDDARRRRRPVRRTGLLAVAAAAALLVGGLGASNVMLRQDRAEQLASGSRLDQVVRTVADGSGRRVALRDDKQRVTAVAVMKGDRVSLVVDGLAANQRGTTYVLWAQAPAGGVRAVGAFDVRADGVEVVRDLPLGASRDGAAGFAITHESGTVAPHQPRVAPVASGTVEDI